MNRRVTIRDIAQDVGYHFTTVSMALRKHPDIPERTRLKIEASAARLGYRPDPVLGALMSYRTELRKASYLGTLAWVTNYPSRTGWRAVQPFEEFFEGARQEADRRGYRIEEFWLGEPGMTPRRMAQILKSRGIQGLLLAPQPAVGTELAFEWDAFAAVTFGYTLAKPALHGVSNHHFRSMLLLVEQLFALGYRRCGYVEERRVDARVSYSWLGAYQVAHDAAGRAREIPPLQFNAWSEVEFAQWFDRYRPDVIVTKYPPVKDWLESRGLRLPDDVGLASPSLADRETEWAGMHENAVAIGRAAVSVLGDLLRHQDLGVPATPQRVMIEGVWTRGRTVRALQGAGGDAAAPEGSTTR
ncbi:LacI family DNA-binding transcriptional regulator [Opitutales bacterium ASA1]|uniref:LacI family DNA-binding transcriptional regulator n=1 Tax=Congregicoccus parvus TaxID=3081749 RepID=UPI002B297578|nr:LacI family DNA-binding transcriptional regulator [Opitutales bacterium ASA1]